MTTNIREDVEENDTAERESYGEIPFQVEEKLKWFQDQKIGVIFHWGLYAEAGIVESWQLSKEDEWARGKSWRKDLDTLRKDYWALNQVFDPVNFNPEEWAKQAKATGFKYMIFTTKHHDGFNMYDTKYSDYKITASKSKFHDHQKADIFKHVTEAFRAENIATGAYYSKADWHCPYYWVPGQEAKGRYASYDPLSDPEMWGKFDRFVENQLVEICSDYGPIDILWLDAGWVNSRNEKLSMDKIVQKLRKIKPDMLIVDRTIGGKHENYVTPERKVPEVPPTKVWESNIRLANNWGYVPNDTYKSFDEILQYLLQVVALGGNIIFGVGPKPDGQLPEEALILMKELGKWLNTYGEGIYGTRPTNQLSAPEWYFTAKGDTIYGFTLTKGKETVSLKIDDSFKRVENFSGTAIKINEGIVTVATENCPAVGLRLNRS